MYVDRIQLIQFFAIQLLINIDPKIKKNDSLIQYVCMYNSFDI